MSKKALLAGAVCVMLGAVLSGRYFTTTPHQEISPPLMALEAAMQAKEGERADQKTFDERRLPDPTTGQIPTGMRQRELNFAKKLPHRMRGPGQTDKAFTGWEVRGPGNIGGRVRALAIDVSDPTYQTLLAGGVSGGMWRSTDDGDTWARVNDPGQLQTISCLAQDTRPGREHVFYYGTGEFHSGSASSGGDLYRGDGIYKSTDGGLSWQVLPATSTNIPQATDQPFDWIQNLAIDTSETTYDEVYAATTGFIYRSLDGGISWDPVLGDPSEPADYTDVIVSPTGIVYAGLSSDGGIFGVFRSPNGVDWTDITPAGLEGHARLVLALAPSDENLLFMTDTADIQLVNGVFVFNYATTGFRKFTLHSGDGSGMGGIWEDRTDNLYVNSTHSYSPYNFPYTQFGYDQCTAIGPEDPNTVILGAVDVWRSTDGFTTRNEIDLIGGWGDPNHHADVHRIIFQPGSSTVAYTASDGGIHKTMDITAKKVKWISLNNGFHTTQFYTVAVDPDLPGDTTIIGGTQDNGTLWTDSHDPGSDWTMPLGGDGAFCAVVDAAVSPGEYFLSYYFGNIFRCQIGSDGRTVTETLVSPKGPEPRDFLFINPYIIDPVAEQIVYVATCDGIWRNDNWWEIPLNIKTPIELNWVHLTDFPADEYVSALAVAATGDRALFYGTEKGQIFRVTDAPTAPEGTIPETLNNQAAFPEGAYVSSISVHPEDDQKVLLSFANYMVSSLWYSQDGGLSWVEVEGNLAGDDGPSVRAVNIMPYEGTDHWFIGTSIGVFSTVYSEGEPVTWELEATELIGNAIVDALACRPTDGLVVAATHGLGIYSVNLPGSVIANNLQPDPIVTQNTPNPFNPMTTISYNLPRTEQVSLRVFDVSGKLVRVLRDGQTEPAGEHQVTWDGTDGSGRQVPSGIYLYSLEAGTLHTKKKMTLVR